MSEQKPHTKYIPLRVRFRPPSEYYQYGRDKTIAPASAEVPQYTPRQIPDLSHASTTERRTQQIKELVRLGNLLRADLGLDDVLAQITSSMSACIGFRLLAVNLINDEGTHLLPVAFAGVSEHDQQVLQEKPTPIEAMMGYLQPQFRISQSYFIPHEHAARVFEGKTTVIQTSHSDYVAGGWHPEDFLLLPLYSPREQKLLGLLSLDEPEDGKIPTQESIEIVELFANQTALAIDSAYLFQEREAERVTLEKGITALREDLDLLRQGDLRLHVRATHEKLQPVADAVNSMVARINTVLSSIQLAVPSVTEHAHKVQESSDALVNITHQQALQIQQISHTVSDLVRTVFSLSERLTGLSSNTTDTQVVIADAQEKVDQAIAGMRQVRETTMQSARTMKSLGESGQEINEAIVSLTDLSMRMHIVALNAAIEATRSAEHGQGFSIVAQEIRTLATQSAEAARKVASYIRIIQNETTTASHSVEQNIQHVITQTELVTQTGISLEAICMETETLTNLITDIQTTAESQSASAPRVVSAAQDVLSMTEELNQHTRSMQQSTSRLVEMTNVLRSHMAEIHLRER